MRYQGNNYFYHKNHLGSITGITDSNGSTAKTYQYEAFGKIRSMSGALTYNPFTYTGRERHVASGLYYYRARWYDPQLGRFITQDPIGHLGGPNLYAYVANDPMNLIDPLGLLLPGERFLLQHGDRIMLIGVGAAGVLAGAYFLPMGIAVAASAGTIGEGLAGVAIATHSVVLGISGLTDLMKAAMAYDADLRGIPDDSVLYYTASPVPPLNATGNADKCPPMK